MTKCFKINFKYIWLKDICQPDLSSIKLSIKHPNGLFEVGDKIYVSSETRSFYAESKDNIAPFTNVENFNLSKDTQLLPL